MSFHRDLIYNLDVSDRRVTTTVLTVASFFKRYVNNKPWRIDASDTVTTTHLISDWLNDKTKKMGFSAYRKTKKDNNQ